MKTLKVLFVFGTRPEAIKMAPLVLAMRRDHIRFNPVVCVTGQHREMLDAVLHTFGIVPDVDLEVMVPSQTLASLSARVLEKVDETLLRTQPDLVLVQGDTTTAFAGTLAAFYRNVPVGHVEAGLRTGDLRDPFPEEANRILIDRLARYCFAPTVMNRLTLLKEGVRHEQIFVTGNTGIDALLITRETIADKPADAWLAHWGSAADVIKDSSRDMVLITMHRRESFGPKLEEIFNSIAAVADAHPSVDFVYPVHLNPNVSRPARAILQGRPNVHLIRPLPYQPFVYLMNRACLIVTDSGGIQEEAPSLGKRVIVVRDKTERQEALSGGTIRLSGVSALTLVKLVTDALSVPRDASPAIDNPYGDGNAAEKILKIIWEDLGGG